MTEIPEGENVPEDESNFVLAARSEVSKLVKANRVNRWWRWLTALVVIVLAGGVWNQHQQDINACHAGNDFRIGNEQIWGYFIGIAVSPKSPPSDLAKAHALLAYVNKVDAPRSCEGWSSIP